MEHINSPIDVACKKYNFILRELTFDSVHSFIRIEFNPVLNNDFIGFIHDIEPFFVHWSNGFIPHFEVKFEAYMSV